jgi:hypothetical protein
MHLRTLVAAAILSSSCGEFEGYPVVCNGTFSPIRVELTLSDGSKVDKTLGPGDDLAVMRLDLGVRAIRASLNGKLLWELGPRDVDQLRGSRYDSDIQWKVFLDGVRPTPRRPYPVVVPVP